MNGTAVARDRRANDMVKQQILAGPTWNRFAGSNCMAVLSNQSGLGAFSLSDAIRRENDDQFYDLTHEQSASWTGKDIATAPQDLQIPAREDGLTLAQLLGAGNARTINLGSSGPILLRSGLLSGSHPEFTLVHEILIHSLKGWNDLQVYGTPYFTGKGLWGDGKGSITITTWIGTDCTCTPGDPNILPPKSCKANTAKWQNRDEK